MIVEADAANAAGSSREAAVDDVVVDADRLENLGPLVALQGRDAHLAHHLEHALGDPLAVSGDDRFVGPFGPENAVVAAPGRAPRRPGRD